MPPRLPQLDFLRSLAILMVAWFHFSTGRVAQAGWAGVDLFFVLSGFLVSGLLFAEQKKYGRIAVGRFLVRRGLKIYPAFWVLILVTVIVAAGRVRPLALVCELGFIQNYGPGLWVHTWTLAVEEHFYFAVGLILAWMGRRDAALDPFRVIPSYGVILALVALTLRGLTVSYLPARLKMNEFGTHLRFDGLLFGVVLAYWYHWHHGWLRTNVARWRWTILTASTLGLIPLFLVTNQSLWFRTVGLTLLDLAFAGMLAVLVTSDRAARWLRGQQPLAWLAALGAYSYTIYLWHIPVSLWLVSPWFKSVAEPMDTPYIAAVSVAAAVAFGILASKLIEVRCLSLRDRLVPRYSSPVMPDNVEMLGATNPMNPEARYASLDLPAATGLGTDNS